MYRPAHSKNVGKLGTLVITLPLTMVEPGDRFCTRLKPAGRVVVSVTPVAGSGPLLVTASACALVAAVLTITTLFALPAVWRGGRRVDSWPILRRCAFTLTLLIYATFAVLLARAGALSPWSS